MLFATKGHWKIYAASRCVLADIVGHYGAAMVIDCKLLKKTSLPTACIYMGILSLACINQSLSVLVWGYLQINVLSHFFLSLKPILIIAFLYCWYCIALVQLIVHEEIAKFVLLQPEQLLTNKFSWSCSLFVIRETTVLQCCFALF